MTHFTGAHVGKLDIKGRIIVPKPFRDTLNRLAAVPGAPLMKLLPSQKGDFIEAWPIPVYEAYSAKRLAELEADPEAIDDFKVNFHWPAQDLDPDVDGRLKLPTKLAAHAKLVDEMLFVGDGDKFLLMTRETAMARLQEAAQRRNSKPLPLVAVGDA